jgi:hypothetical protein
MSTHKTTPTQLQIDWAIGVLRKVSNAQAKLDQGIRRRNEMHTKLADGEKLNCARYRWIQESANKVLDTLRTAAKQFNSTNLDDKISTDDLGDCLATVQGFLQKIGK